MTKLADWEKIIRFGVINYNGPHELNFEKAIAKAAKDPVGLGSTNIWSAAAFGDIISLGQLLAKDPSLAVARGGPYDWMPILYLCHSRIRVPGQDWLASLKLLLENGAEAKESYTVSDTYHFSCLTAVMGEGEAGTKLWPPHPNALELAKTLLERGADPNEGQGLYNTMFSDGTHWLELLTSFGLGPEDPINWDAERPIPILDYLLNYACRMNQIDRAKFLLSQGANPNAIDWYDGEPALKQASTCGNLEIAKLLVEAGAEEFEWVNDKEKFFHAAVTLDKSVVKELETNLGTDTLKTWSTQGETILAKQVELNRIDVVSYLLELGFPTGQSLFDAAWNGHFAMARLLVEQGASVRKRDAGHQVTPIAFANRTGFTDLRDYLLTQDADIFDIISFGSVERLEELIVADPGSIERKFSEYVEDCPELDDITPLTHAVMRGKAEQVDLLMQLGADPHVIHPDGRNLAQIATEFIESQT